MSSSIPSYQYNNELYAGPFPKLWSEFHAPNTGPVNCITCKKFGTWNGAFLSYCISCASAIYKGHRGKGIHLGMSLNESQLIDYNVNVGECIYETYMKNISLDDIGDPTIVDTRAKYYLGTVRDEIPIYKETEKITMLELFNRDNDDEDEDEDSEDDFEKIYQENGRFVFEYGCDYNGGYDSY